MRYGAKTIPVGGWYSIPRTYLDGGLIIGDSASLLNSQRLKGIHMAIKSGMLAAETILERLARGRHVRRKAFAHFGARWMKAGSDASCGACAIFISRSSTAFGAAWRIRLCNL